MLWLLPLGCGAIGLAVLAVLAARLRRELEPTALLIDRFGHAHRVALSRLADQTEAARRRLSRD